MTRVDKPALLKRLFELGAEWSGQILAYNKMLGQLQDAGNTTTLARYLDLLAAAGLLAGLQRGPRLVGIEVKSGPRRADLRGMDAFSARFGPARTLIAGEGGIPINEFLSAPADHWLDEP